MPSSFGSEDLPPYVGPRRIPPPGPLPRRRRTPPKPPRRVVTPNLARRHSRRDRGIAAVLTVSLVVLVTGVWATPYIRIPGRGPTALEVELATVKAANEDLAEQNAEMSGKLKAPRPPVSDDVNAARAEDLLRQVEELEDKLGIPRPPKTDGVQAARAEDLADRLKRAEEKLKAPRPPATDGISKARADDLARQLAEAHTQLTRPRPTVDPLANVTATMTKAEIVNSRNLFGMYTTQSPFNYGEVDLVQGLVQRKANVVGYFQSWRDDFNAFPIKNAWSRGQVPLMTWESQAQVGNIQSEQPEFSLSRIHGGAWDDYIRSYARGLRDLRLPVIIRFDHEMNGNWYPWSEWSDARGVSVNGNQHAECQAPLTPGPDCPGEYINAWRHVHDIFEEEGANNYAIWLWSPNRVNRICGQRRPVAFYPGDRYVDWIGMSGYYRNYDTRGGDCDDIGASFDAVFKNTLIELRNITGRKPILLSEIGATERGGDKVAWIADLFRGLQDNSDIIGFSWFSLAVSSGGETDRFTHDWRINSSPEAQNAMRDGLNASTIGLPHAG